MMKTISYRNHTGWTDVRKAKKREEQRNEKSLKYGNNAP